MTKKILMLVLSSALIFTGCGVNVFEKDSEDTQQMLTIEEAKDVLVNKYGFTKDEVESFDAYALVKDFSLDEVDYDADEVRHLYEEYKETYADADFSEKFYIFDATSQADLKKTDEITKIGFEFSFGDEWEEIVVDFENNEYHYNSLGTIYSKPLPSNTLKEDIYVVSNWKHDINLYEDESTGSVSYRIIIETTEGKYCCYEAGGSDDVGFPDGYENIYKEVQAILE